MVWVFFALTIGSLILGFVFQGMDNVDTDAFRDVTGVRRSHSTGQPIGQSSGGQWANWAGYCFMVMFVSCILAVIAIVAPAFTNRY